jgi:hypothetical protein
MNHKIGLVLMLLLLVPALILADVIQLRTGERIEVDAFWEKDGKIYFYYHGVKACVSKDEVRDMSARKSDLHRPSPRSVESTRVDHVERKKTGRNLSEPNSPLPAGTPPQPRLASIAPDRMPIPSHSTGFRDLHWGLEKAEINNLVALHTPSGLKNVKEYVRSQENLVWGDAELQSITYAFWKNKLYTLTIWTEGYQNYDALRKMALITFGTGRQSDLSRQKYIWSDEHSDRLLKYVQEDQAGMLWMRSKEIDRRIRIASYTAPFTYMRSK